jgi:hypothetical protein
VSGQVRHRRRRQPETWTQALAWLGVFLLVCTLGAGIILGAGYVLFLAVTEFPPAGWLIAGILTGIAIILFQKGARR